MRWLFLVVSTFLTAVLVVYVASSFDLDAARETVRPETLPLLAATGLLYTAVLALRGTRIALASHWLSGARLTVFDGAEVATLHSLANHLLPFRLGESAFIVLTRFVFRVPIANAAGLLLVLRLYDVVALLIIGAVGWVIWQGSVVPLAIAVGFFLLAARLDLFLRLAATLALRFGERAAGWAHRLRDGSHYVRHPRFVAMAFGSSIAIWMVQASFFASIWWALGEHVAFERVLVPTAITNLAGFIPASALGTFGPLEAGWTAGFVWVGQPRETAAITGIVMHLVVVATCGILSALFVLHLGPRLWQGVAEWRSGEPSG